jgi:dipeptidase E
MTGGGNTFKLLHDLYQTNVINLIKEKVNKGTPYIGWSAGANITGETISTTNDMPVINPGSFDALGFFPFQINPHYYNVQMPGFNGETRDQRLEEFLMLHPSKTIVALPEGTALLLNNGTLYLTGNKNAILFTYKNNAVIKTEISAGGDFTYLSRS